MRAFEIVLSLANALALACLAVRRHRSGCPAGFVGAAAALCACLQVFLEGQRWQMVPAYALTAVLLLAGIVQVEELVSRGYVVVGLDQPGGSAAVRLTDGRTVTVLPREQIQTLIQQSITPAAVVPVLNGRPLPDGIIPCFAQDVSFSIDQLTALNHRDPNVRPAEPLTGRLDLDRLGVFGISLGAMVAGEACLRDARVKAALMMDAAMPADVVRAGLRQPCIWISRPASDMRLERSRSGGWPESSITETLATMRAVFDAHQRGRAYYLDMPGMFHVNFTDVPFWSLLTAHLGLTGPVDGVRMWGIVNAYSVAFFDEYLKGRQESLLDEPAGQPQGVRLYRR